MAEGTSVAGWHVREWLAAAGVLWSVVFVGVLGLVFRAGQVFREHVEMVDLVRSIKGDLKEMKAQSAESGEKRDREREALRMELKEDIACLHRRVDEALRK